MISLDESADYIKEFTAEDWKSCYEYMSKSYYKLRDETRFTPKWVMKFFKWMREK